MLVPRAALKAIDFAGLRIFDYTAGHEVSSSLAVIEVPPGVQHAQAWSKRSDKYYLVVSGRVRFVLDDVASELAAGDFCLVRRGQRFRYANEAGADATLVLVHTPSFDLDAEVFVKEQADSGRNALVSMRIQEHRFHSGGITGGMWSLVVRRDGRVRYRERRALDTRSRSPTGIPKRTVSEQFARLERARFLEIDTSGYTRLTARPDATYCTIGLVGPVYSNWVTGSA